MRVLLIKPSVRGFRVEIERHVPIGPAYLAACLRDHGHEVSLFDALSFTEDNHVVDPADYTEADRLKLDRHPRWRYLVHWGASQDRLAKAIEQAAPQVVGISCMFTPYYESAYEAARLVREIAPDALVIFGGQHPTVAHHHALAEPAFDILVRGEGEHTLPRVLDAFVAGSPLTGIPGLVFRCDPRFCGCDRHGGGAHVTPAAAQVPDLDALPLPATDLLDFDRYARSTTLITSRGCPFSCTFCTVHATVGKAFRYRSPQNVVEEIRHYVLEYGVRVFRIEDDNFTFDIDRVRELCGAIRASGLDVELHLANGITVVKLSHDLVRDMAGAGLRSLFLGLETTEPARLRKLRKGFTSVDKVRTGADWFLEEGVEVGASLIVGLLGQDLDQAAQDACRLASAGIRFGPNPFYPIPGSTDYENCLRLGIVSHDIELGLFEGFNFAIGSDLLSPEEMYWAWVYANALSFWPGYVFDRRDDGAGLSLDRALVELSAWQAAHPPRADRFEVLAEPGKASGNVVWLTESGCFCRLQQVRELTLGGGPVDFCTLSGDIVAAGVAMRVGRPVSARQVSSAVHTTGTPCAFEITEGAVGADAAVHRAYLRALSASGKAPVAV
ncbi:hypothetical protein SD37_26915 [Amycolatopsis orientalis]|uniref:Uncharacterized protein n=1 Tax=Amycolatopsis orientalis TaxID=31958 RepID=A0A193C2Y4_AMYOR|nr:cobalamin-dependent protein [Amycolatopsis orientalis]ANN18896.1 hypothetical protein SD37_26915 [Amycolatopsis orientalis]